jgi:GNAT superfamily N-acetyltransferase
MSEDFPASLTVDAIHVRRLGAGDSLAKLTELLHRAYAPLAAAGLHYVASHQSEAVTAQRIAGKECYVALAGARIVGTILLAPPGRSGGCAYYERPGVATFHQFAVDPEYQGQGVGGLLLNRVELRARELGAAELALDTAEGAHHLIARYERCGYRVVDRVDWEQTNYVSVIMSKSFL